MSENAQEQVEAKLLAYVEGELDDADRDDIERHLEANPKHRQLLADLSAGRARVRGLPRESAPPELFDGFQAQLERHVLLATTPVVGPSVGGGGADAEAAGPADPRARRWARVRFAAAAVVVAGGIGVIVYSSLPRRYTEGLAFQGPNADVGAGAAAPRSPAATALADLDRSLAPGAARDGSAGAPVPPDGVAAAPARTTADPARAAGEPTRGPVAELGRQASAPPDVPSVSLADRAAQDLDRRARMKASADRARSAPAVLAALGRPAGPADLAADGGRATGGVARGAGGGAGGGADPDGAVAKRMAAEPASAAKAADAGASSAFARPPEPLVLVVASADPSAVQQQVAALLRDQSLTYTRVGLGDALGAGMLPRKEERLGEPPTVAATPPPPAPSTPGTPAAPAAAAAPSLAVPSPTADPSARAEDPAAPARPGARAAVRAATGTGRAGGVPAEVAAAQARRADRAEPPAKPATAPSAAPSPAAAPPAVSPPPAGEAVGSAGTVLVIRRVPRDRASGLVTALNRPDLARYAVAYGDVSAPAAGRGRRPANPPAGGPTPAAAAASAAPSVGVGVGGAATLPAGGAAPSSPPVTAVAPTPAPAVLPPSAAPATRPVPTTAPAAARGPRPPAAPPPSLAAPSPAGQAPATPAAATPPAPASRPAAGDPIGRGEPLQLVYRNLRRARPVVTPVTVNDRGAIVVAGLGEVEVGGLTPQQASARITDGLKSRVPGSEGAEVRRPTPEELAAGPRGPAGGAGAVGGAGATAGAGAGGGGAGAMGAGFGGAAATRPTDALGRALPSPAMPWPSGAAGGPAPTADAPAQPASADDAVDVVIVVQPSAEPVGGPAPGRSGDGGNPSGDGGNPGYDATPPR